MDTAKLKKRLARGDIIDFSNISLKGRWISGLDFSKAVNLTAENWLSAERIHRCKLPAGMDFTNCSLRDRDVSGIDFSKVTNLNPQTWANARYCYSTKLPEGMDFTNVSLAGKVIVRVDFSGVKGLTAENWLSAGSINGCKLPAGMDFSNASLKHRNIEQVDFSRVKGLTVKNWQSANDINYSILPEMDFSNYVDYYCTGVDFSRVKGLTAEQCTNLLLRHNSKIPTDIDLRKVSFSTHNLYDVDFSYVKNITLRQLINSRGFSRVIVSEDIDVGTKWYTLSDSTFQKVIKVRDQNGQIEDKTLGSFLAYRGVLYVQRKMLLDALAW